VVRGNPNGYHDVDEPTVQTDAADMLVAPVRVRTETWEQAAKLHAMIVNRKGLFVRTAREVAIGGDVWIEVVLPSGDVALVRGVVRHVVRRGDHGGQPPGLGVELAGLSDDTRAEAARLLGEHGGVDDETELRDLDDDETQLRSLD
jgi:hypothetical protein